MAPDYSRPTESEAQHAEHDGPYASIPSATCRLWLGWDKTMHEHAKAGNIEQTWTFAEMILAQATMPLLLRARALTILALKIDDPDAEYRAREALRLLDQVKAGGKTVPERCYTHARKALALALEDQAKRAADEGRSQEVGDSQRE